MIRKRRLHPPPLSSLGIALHEMRRRRQLTQAELAERTEQTQARISAIESGTLDPRASTLVSLAAALGCEWVLVPKDRAREALRSAGLTRQPAAPTTLLDEIQIADDGNEP